MDRIYPLLAAIALAGVYISGWRIHVAEGKGHREWISVAAGVSVAYVFINIIPELGSRQQRFLENMVGQGLLFANYWGYLAALFGFVLYYGLDKALGSPPRAGGESRLARLHLHAFAAYNLLIGYFLTERAEQGLLSLALYAVAMGLHFRVTSHSLTREHGDAYLTWGRWSLAAALLAGWLIGVVAPLSVTTMVILFGLVAGTVVINSIKDELPAEGAARFWPFLVGALGYALLLMLI